MKWFYNMKIGVKLLVGFGIVAILTLAVGIIGVTQITKADREFTALYNDFGSPLGQIGAVGIYFNRIRFNLLSMTQSNRGNAEIIVAKIEKYDQKISDGLNRYGKTLRTIEGKREFSRLTEDYQEYQSVQQRIINFTLTGQRGQALLLLNGEAQTLSEEMNKIIDGQFSLKVKAGEAKSKAIKTAVSQSIWMMVVIVLVGAVLAFVIGIFIAGTLKRPIKKLVESVDSLLHGNVDVHIEATSQDEIGVLMNSFARMVETIRGMINETDMLARAAMEGRLDARGKSEAFEGSWGELIQGFNQILDSVIGPLNVAAEYIERIGKGDIPPKITETYYGDFNEIKNNLNACIDGLSALTECNHALNCMADNDYTTQVQSGYPGVFGAIAENINIVRDRLNHTVGILDNISDGNFTDLDGLQKIGRRSENDHLMPAMTKMIETINGLINETVILSRAAVEGRLDARGEAAKYRGEFGKVIEGINQTLDAVIGPLNVTAEYVDRISKGDIPPKITDTYYGDFNEIKNNFNQCIDVINALIQNTNQLAMEASEGNLAVRGETGKFNGGYAQIVAGFNATLDAVINPLNEAEQVLARIAMNDYTMEMTGDYNGKLKELKESINSTRGRLLSVQDALVRASKGDTSRLDEFKKIGRRSENDQMMPAMTALYQSIQDIIEEVDRLSQAGINGNLKLRGDVQHFEGGFREIVEGFNQTLDAIVAPTTEASAVLHEMANGNLQVNVNGDYKGDHAALKDSVNLAIDSFNEVLREFNGASEQVASGAREVSDSSQALSQGSAEQASTVEEITASMEEIAAQTKQNAVNAGQANELSNTAKENAIQGNERMKEMLRAMDGINDSSANISKIIKVIDEIAFQTNILALNAAVEAARAGQHGKGFAVVAEEVRNLAARSANAAKETTALIEGSIKKVEAGTQIANETAKALDHIVTEVSKATGLVGEIAVASNEQATAITQINQGVSQVSQVTQNNSAMAEQSASASEELASQAQILKEMVQRFKIKAGSGNTNTNTITASVNAKRQVNESIHKGKAEAAVTASRGKKVNISLDDGEFGKY